MKATRERSFTHVCKQCNHMWFSALEEPTKCARCESRGWNKEGEVRDLYIPLPVFNHDGKKNLPFIGAKCPYCRGTTGIDSVEKISFCYSCDYCWDLYGNPLGVKMGIGAR